MLERLWLWFGVSRVQCLGIVIHSCHVPLVNLWGASRSKKGLLFGTQRIKAPPVRRLPEPGLVPASTVGQSSCVPTWPSTLEKSRHWATQLGNWKPQQIGRLQTWRHDGASLQIGSWQPLGRVSRVLHGSVPMQYSPQATQQWASPAGHRRLFVLVLWRNRRGTVREMKLERARWQQVICSQEHGDRGGMSIRELAPLYCSKSFVTCALHDCPLLSQARCTL